MNTVDKGEVYRSSVEFRDSTGALANPTTITVKYETPAGTETTKTYAGDPAVVIRPSTGVFYIDITASTAGVWPVLWIGTGAVAQSFLDPFFVKEHDFA
jgi:hypothetical protein